jgi:hypothetical protein
VSRLREQPVWSIIVVLALAALIVNGIATGTWLLVVAGAAIGAVWALGMNWRERRRSVPARERP